MVLACSKHLNAAFPQLDKAGAHFASAAEEVLIALESASEMSAGQQLYTNGQPAISTKCTACSRIALNDNFLQSQLLFS